MDDINNPPPPVDPVLPAPAAQPAARIPRGTWTDFQALPNFDLRNGALVDIVPVLIRATIQTAWKWVPITGMPPERAIRAIDGYIASHLAHMTANRPEAATDALIRKFAIVVGTIRAVATTFYRLQPGDFIAGELADALLTYSPTADGEIGYTVNANALEAQRTQLSTVLEFSQQETAVICALIRCGTGVVAMQGYSLIMTNHHYLSGVDAQSRKIFAVAEKAYWRHADIGDWFTVDLELLQTAAWHRATHPIQINIKTTSAMSDDIAEKLEAAGAGACASRLPALESELRAANSYTTLFGTVRPMLMMYGGELNFLDFAEAARITKMIPQTGENHPIIQELPPNVKTGVTNRTTALRAIGEMIRRNVDTAAYCYGFYVNLSETMANQVGTAQAGQETLKTSFSLSKLKGQSPASYWLGFQACTDYLAMRAKARNDGVFTAPTMTAW